MRTLGLIRRGTAAPPPDLWMRFEARMRERDEVVRVTLPAVGWGELAAVAALVIVIPRSCSCSIQSMVAAPSCTSPILWEIPV